MNLTQYIVRRLLFAIPVLVFVSFFAFSIIHLVPGDPARMMVNPKMGEEVVEQVREKLGLNRPLYTQYFLFLKRLLKGDLGNSLYTKEKISDMIFSRLPRTIVLMVTGLLLAYILAIPIGILSAVYQGKFLDHFSMGIATVGIGVPRFWLGLLLILIFSVNLGWFPVAGYGDVKHLILPLITLSFTSMAYVARVMRSSMLEFMKKDFVTTARAKGVKELRIVIKHLLKNSINPVVALFGLDFGWMLGGAVMVEYVFNRPGLGRLMIDSIYMRDYPVFQVLVLFLTTSVILGNLIADVLLAIIDPRITHK
jgi:peptide/nickel transport system permease protein